MDRTSLDDIRKKYLDILFLRAMKKVAPQEIEQMLGVVANECEKAGALRIFVKRRNDKVHNDGVWMYLVHERNDDASSYVWNIDKYNNVLLEREGRGMPLGMWDPQAILIPCPSKK